MSVKRIFLVLIDVRNKSMMVISLYVIALSAWLTAEASCRYTAANTDIFFVTAVVVLTCKVNYTSRSQVTELTLR